jgi:RimJ/RimL family protein N-acetyltransferase
MSEELTQSSFTAGNLVVQPTSPALAAALLAGDFSGIKPGEGWPHDDTMDGLGMVAQGRALGWLVTLDGLVIGECGTHALSDAGGVVEIGYGLAAPYRGRGHGRDLVRALSQWFMTQPSIVGVLAHTVPDNMPSRRSLESAGFRLDGEDDGECRYVLGEA